MSDQPSSTPETFVHHPREGFSGPVTIGRRTLTFDDGVAVRPRGPFASWRRAGYTLSDTRDRPESAIFDPSKVTAAKVVERLSDPSTTDVERDRILDAERSGKARKTILEWVPVDEDSPEDVGPLDPPEGETE